MQIRVGCEFRYESTWPTPAVMQVQPHQEAEQRVLHEVWQFDPSLDLHDYTDLYGNTCQRILMPVGNQVISYDATIEVSGLADEVAPDAVQLPVEDLPDNVLHYTLPSRFCLSDVLSDMAWQHFGAIEPGWVRVQAICDWVHSNIRFQYGTSNSLTTAADVCAAGVGVCRDFAHLAVTFCRALNIPARYVFGYLPDIGVPAPDAPMDFCAWMEVYLSGRWWTFDPRNNVPRIGRVLVGRGRDALDVAMVTTYGSPHLAQMTVWADEALPAPNGNEEATDMQASSLRGDRRQA
jgi:transglutaminase-like putative cysteine protease